MVDETMFYLIVDFKTIFSPMHGINTKKLLIDRRVVLLL